MTKQVKTTDTDFNQVLNTLEVINNKIDIDIERIKNFAKGLGFTLRGIDKENKFYTNVHKVFPFEAQYAKSLCSRDLKALAHDLVKVSRDKEFYAYDPIKVLHVDRPKNHIKFDSLNEKDFEQMVIFAGVNPENILSVQEFKNGNSIKCFNDTDFEKVLNLLYFVNSDTQKVLNSITDRDKKQARKSAKTLGRYTVAAAIINNVHKGYRTVNVNPVLKELGI